MKAVSHASGSYFSPSYQGFVLESQCPDSYLELKKKFHKMPSDASCDNVALSYSLVTHPKGHPVEERVSYRCPKMTPKQLLEMVECITPSSHSFPSLEKARNCLEKICLKGL